MFVFLSLVFGVDTQVFISADLVDRMSHQASSHPLGIDDPCFQHKLKANYAWDVCCRSKV